MKSLIIALSLLASACTPAFAAPPKVIQPLSWEKNHPERIAWSKELLQDFQNNLATFDKAGDVASFCPKWKTLDADHKVHVLATMAVSIALYESAYNPNSIYHEPPPLGINSVGLFQLSYEDRMSWCSMVAAQKTLQNPITNISCAVPEMAKLTRENGVISGYANGWRGLARYWSTMRSSGKLGAIKGSTLALGFCR